MGKSKSHPAAHGVFVSLHVQDAGAPATMLVSCGTSMIHEHIEQIQAKVHNAKGIPDETKADLLKLLSELRAEVGVLSETNEEDAHSVARFVAASTHEATRTERKPELLEPALQGLTSSVNGLATSHPQLADIVNRIAVTLSNMGI
jgi:Domain of unknown function (DUF4404)